MVKTIDDFNWETYHNIYEKQLFNEMNNDLIISNFVIENGEIVFYNNLHENHKELYHQIFDLDVKSVFECGFGCGHHLINIHKINPQIEIGGAEYSNEQMNVGIKHFGLNKHVFFKNLKILDFSEPIKLNEYNTYDFVYTQAVTMHLSYEKAKKFLMNMKLMSNKYIFLIENINSHDYNMLINEIFFEFEVVRTSKYINYGILLKKI